jgi:hypothetical protein
MASPFPGLDPFIEAQGFWPDFHARFITYLCDTLAETLPADRNFKGDGACIDVA